VRVIAGSAKGVRLAPVPRGVRPVSDMAREGLFSSLGELVEGARVLDLFAGTGALGIEALSRGAASATFVEREPAAVRTIRANLERTKLADRASVVAGEVSRVVIGKSDRGTGFGLCFLDPPYEAREGEVEPLLSGLAAGWLAPGFTVALTRRIRSSTLVIPVNWAVARRLEYGDTLVILYREG
jgi:16S rRNA (guanine966-N2)-methyltransferase